MGAKEDMHADLISPGFNGAVRRYLAPAKRLAAKLSPPTDRGCLEFQGFLNNRGYGQIGVNGGLMYAHRVAWIAAHGSIPSGLFVCHTCDNRRCCNVEHLFLGTQLDNMQDMIQKGRDRHPRGEANPRSRISDLEIQEMRAAYAAGESAYSIARRFGRFKSRSHINRICQGQERA